MDRIIRFVCDGVEIVAEVETDAAHDADHPGDSVVSQFDSGGSARP